MHAILTPKEKTKTSSSSPPVRLFSRARKKYGLFIIAVVVPTLLSIIYFGLISSDIYVSQSSFLVRGPQPEQSSMSGLGAVLQGAGLSGASGVSDNVFAVNEYITSRDALRDLNDQLKLSADWSSPKIDFLHRFGLFGHRTGFEYLYLYYQDRISVTQDTQSPISTLEVDVFSAEQARQINEMLLQAAEHLVNKLNERAQQDLIRYASEEVDSAQKRVKEAAMALSNYRNQQGVVDPESQTSYHFELVAKLQEDLITTKTELANLRAFAPQSPSPPALEVKVKTLQESIDAEMAKIAGSQDSLSSKDAQFQQLLLERQFAEQEMTSALASLEAAKSEAQRQQLYLEVIAQPTLPDVAMEPKRIEGVLTTLLAGLIAWGILSMLIAGTMEHQM